MGQVFIFQRDTKAANALVSAFTEAGHSPVVSYPSDVPHIVSELQRKPARPVAFVTDLKVDRNPLSRNDMRFGMDLCAAVSDLKSRTMTVIYSSAFAPSKDIKALRTELHQIQEQPKGRDIGREVQAIVDQVDAFLGDGIKVPKVSFEQRLNEIFRDRTGVPMGRRYPIDGGEIFLQYLMDNSFSAHLEHSDPKIMASLLKSIDDSEHDMRRPDPTHSLFLCFMPYNYACDPKGSKEPAYITRINFSFQGADEPSRIDVWDLKTNKCIFKTKEGLTLNQFIAAAEGLENWSDIDFVAAMEPV